MLVNRNDVVDFFGRIRFPVSNGQLHTTSGVCESRRGESMPVNGRVCLDFGMKCMLRGLRESFDTR